MANRGWVPVVASVGIGAAAYYSMTRGKGMGKTAMQFAPFISNMAQGQQQQQGNQTTNQNNQFDPPIYS